MGNFHTIGRDVRTKIFREYLDDQDRLILMYAFNVIRNGTDVDQFFVVGVAAKGHLEILKWLETTHYYVLEHYISVATMSAACEGHIHILEHYRMYTNVYDDHTMACCFENAIRYGRIAVLMWIEEQFPYFNWEKLDWRGMSLAACYGRFEILKWLYEKGCEITRGTFQNAISSGNLELIKWVHDKGGSYRGCTMTSAAMCGKLDVLKWAKSEDLMTDENSCMMYAKKYGHVEIVMWLESL